MGGDQSRTSRTHRSAGLSASVGQASILTRVALALVFLVIGTMTGGGGLVVSSVAGFPGAAIAVMVLVPFAVVAFVAAAYILVPLSRFGRFLDRNLPAITDWTTALIVLLSLWALGLLVVVSFS